MRHGRDQRRNHVQALSVNLRQNTLDAASRNIGRLRSAIERVKATDADRLRNEYSRLVSGLQQQGALGQPSNSPLPADDTLANPALPDDILREAVRMLWRMLWPCQRARSC